VPRELPQWIRVRVGVPAGERVFIGLDQLIVANAPKLFPGMGIESATLIRAGRDAEGELDDDGVDKRARVGPEPRQRRLAPAGGCAGAGSSRWCASRSSRRRIR